MAILGNVEFKPGRRKLSKFGIQNVIDRMIQPVKITFFWLHIKKKGISL